MVQGVGNLGQIFPTKKQLIIHRHGGYWGEIQSTCGCHVSNIISPGMLYNGFSGVFRPRLEIVATDRGHSYVHPIVLILVIHPSASHISITLRPNQLVGACLSQLVGW